MYLFENHTDESAEFHPDQEPLTTELTEAGFPLRRNPQGASPLEGLSVVSASATCLPLPGSGAALRHVHFAGAGKARRGMSRLLLYMEQSGVVDPTMRELVIDRSMALEVEEIAIDQPGRIVLMVLSNHPGSGTPTTRSTTWCSTKCGVTCDRSPSSLQLPPGLRRCPT